MFDEAAASALEGVYLDVVNHIQHPGLQLLRLGGRDGMLA